MFTTNDDTVPFNVHVLWGSGDGKIYGKSVDFQAPFDVGSNFKPGPGSLPQKKPESATFITPPTAPSIVVWFL